MTEGYRSKEFLGYFWKLAELKDNVRITATENILKHLKEHSDGVEYTAKRLVRGLASSRDAARQGFSLCLTELLKQMESIEIDWIFTLINESTVVSSTMKGMEQREQVFAKLFGYMAVVQSGRLNNEHKVIVLKELIEISKWKNWITELAYECVLVLIRGMEMEEFEKEMKELIMVEVFPHCNYKEWNTEQVALAAGILRYYQIADGVEKVKFNNLLEDLSLIENAMKLASSSYPRIHFVWYHVLEVMAKRDFSPTFEKEVVVKSEMEGLEEFWTVLVENTLLDSTHERKGAAFHILGFLATIVPETQMQTILNANVLGMIYNNASTSKNYLFKQANQLIKVLQVEAPSAYFETMRGVFCNPTILIAEPEKHALDENTSTLEQVAAMEVDRDLQEDYLRRIDTLRMWALDSLCNMLKVTNAAVAMQVSTFVLYHGLFQPKDDLHPGLKCTPPLTKKVTTACQKRFFLSINGSFASRTEINSKRKRLHELEITENRIKTLLCSKSWNLCIALEKTGLELKVPLSKEALERRSKISKVFTSISKRIDAALQQQDGPPLKKSKKSKKKKQTLFVDPISKIAQLEAFAIMLLHVGLHLLDPTADESEALVVVDDLLRCFEEICGKNASESSNDAPIAVLVDTILSLLTQESKVLRNVIKQVFKSICLDITRPALLQLVQVICEQDSNIVPDDDEDDEFAPIDPAGLTTDKGNSDSEDSDEEEIVLNSAADISKMLSEDSSATANPDDALADYVRMVQEKKKKKNNTAKQHLSMVHFRLRALDMLEIYFQQCPDSTHTYFAILPLVKLLHAPSLKEEEKVLHNRVTSFVQNKLSKNRDYPIIGAVIPACADMMKIMNELTELAKTSTCKQFCTIVTHAYLYLLRTLHRIMALDMANVSENMRSAAKGYFYAKRTKMHAIFFDELIARYPDVAWTTLMPTLVEVIKKPETSEDGKSDTTVHKRSEFALSEAYRMLLVMLKQFRATEEVYTKTLMTLAKPMVTSFCESIQNLSEMKSKRGKVVASFGQHLIKAIAAHPEKKALFDLIAAYHFSTIMQESSVLDANSSGVKVVLKQNVNLLSKIVEKE